MSNASKLNSWDFFCSFKRASLVSRFDGIPIIALFFGLGFGFLMWHPRISHVFFHGVHDLIGWYFVLVQIFLGATRAIYFSSRFWRRHAWFLRIRWLMSIKSIAFAPQTWAKLDHSVRIYDLWNTRKATFLRIGSQIISWHILPWKVRARPLHSSSASFFGWELSDPLCFQLAAPLTLLDIFSNR